VLTVVTCKINKATFEAKLKQPKAFPKGFHTMRIYGSDDLKYYYTNIWVGTPPQRQSVIIDTGSDYLAFPCSRCPKGKCGNHNNPVFNIENDKTARIVKCHERIDNYQCNICNKDGNCSFSKSYLEGSSLFGEVYEDNIRLFAPKTLQTQKNTRRLPNMLKKNAGRNEVIHKHDLKGTKGTFGCTMQETGLFKTQKANGIMGLSPRTDTAAASPNFVDSLFIDHKVKNRNFSVCLGTRGGFLTFGGYNTNKHIKGEPIQTVRYTDQYHIKFGGPSAGLSNTKTAKLEYEALLDSGTTFTYLLAPVFNKLASNFTSWCKKTKSPHGAICGGKPVFANNYCVDYKKSDYGSTDKFLATFPKLFFRIANKGELVWFPKDYFELSHKYSNDHMKFCSSINTETMGIGAYSTFGSLFFRHYDVYFNRSKKTVSFARSECEDRSKRAYPILGVKKYIKKVRILMGSLFDNMYGLCGVFLVLAGLIGVILMRYGFLAKFVEMLGAKDQKTANENQTE